MISYFLNKLAEGTFVFQIESQEDRLTNYVKSRPGHYYAARNGWKVMIDKYPAIDLDDRVVYLQGSDHSNDDNISRVYGLGGKECKNTIKAIDDAITEAVEAAKNWKVKTPVFAEVIEIRSGWDPFGPLYGHPGIIIIKER